MIISVKNRNENPYITNVTLTCRFLVWFIFWMSLHLLSCYFILTDDDKSLAEVIFQRFL